MGRVSGQSEGRANRTSGDNGGGENDDGCEKKESRRCPGGSAGAGWNFWLLLRWCCWARFQVRDGKLYRSTAARTQIVAFSKTQRMTEMWSKGSRGRCRHSGSLGSKTQMPIVVQRKRTRAAGSYLLGCLGPLGSAMLQARPVSPVPSEVGSEHVAVADRVTRF